MKESKILRKFLATASLCGTLFTSSNTAGATIPNLGSVSLSPGAGLVGGVFNNGNIYSKDLALKYRQIKQMLLLAG
ncbi:hypothetical protein [Rickettsia rickettsii]|uniref:hypothetical protein n=1 Tax=Rickettsia rickettsii TaxID=783 RepID=UPI0002E77CD6|nr:hypothetical protein [Rickettsia rickettsii]AJG33742.1 hypothetical protein RRR_03370 [Rickettsia rickettsii str. R]AJG35081.1 hypothetical protein RRM_03390 [Rickettsia rickettsii str. Morgan]USD86039.1 hypothetical protein NDY50_03410 [Rickettsia rickettsii]USD87359.1 hypothetical protein NDY48_03385 [Rickettsia rickettsii]USD88674.1 hypothetical protein NDY49_03400 [Rickettsia rickettsii]